DMGPPRLRRSDLPLRDGGPPDGRAVDVSMPVDLSLAGGVSALRVTAISMGNPHCIVRLHGLEPFGAGLQELDLPRIGPLLERHPWFPQRVNVEFVEPLNRQELAFRVWERGSG